MGQTSDFWYLSVTISFTLLNIAIINIIINTKYFTIFSVISVIFFTYVWYLIIYYAANFIDI